MKKILGLFILTLSGWQVAFSQQTSVTPVRSNFSFSGKTYQVDSIISGTWKANQPLKECQIILIGGGGGGGGDATNSGGGGGAGGQISVFSFDRFDDVTSTWTVTAGAGGTAGSSGTINGGNGGNTILSRNGSTRSFISLGGNGGSAASAASTPGVGGSTSLKQVWLTSTDTAIKLRGNGNAWNAGTAKVTQRAGGAISTGNSGGGGGASAGGAGNAAVTTVGGSGANGYVFGDTFCIQNNILGYAPGGGGGKGNGSGQASGIVGTGKTNGAGGLFNAAGSSGVVFVRYLKETDGGVISTTMSSPTEITNYSGQGLRLGSGKHGKLTPSASQSITLASLDLTSASSFTVDGVNGNTTVTVDGSVYLGSSSGVGSNVIIKNGGRLIIEGSINLEPNSFIQLDSGTLTINGKITYGSGTYVRGSNSAEIVFNNGLSSDLFLDQTNTKGNILKTLSLTASSTLNLQSVTQMRGGSIPGMIYLGNDNPTNTSCTLKTNGFLRLLSTSSNKTASVAFKSSNSTLISSKNDEIQIFIAGRGSNNASGNSVPQKNASGFVESSRGWRLFGNPCDTAIYVSQFVDNSGEIDITGGSVSNGFTQSATNNPSGYYYSLASNSWTAFSAINGATSSGTLAGGLIDVSSGFMALVRGTKGQGLTATNYSPSSATIRISGKWSIANKTINLSLGSAATNTFGYYVISNPYPSTISLTNLDLSNVDAGITIYNPKRKSFAAYSKSSKTGTSGGNALIPPGGAFIVHVTNGYTTGSVGFKFNLLTRSTFDSLPEGGVFDVQRGLDSNFSDLRLFISKSGDSSNLFTGDDCLLSIGRFFKASNDFDSEFDAVDMGADIADIGLVDRKNNINLSINEISNVPDSVFLSVKGHKSDDYILSFNDLPLVLRNDYSVILVDRYLNSQVLITDGMSYNFKITADVNSFGNKRFYLLFTKLSGSLGLKNLSENENEISIFPMPAPQNTKVRVVSKLEKIEKLEIHTIDGREISGLQYSFQKDMNEVQFSGLNKGVYYVLVEMKNKKFVSKKIIID